MNIVNNIKRKKEFNIGDVIGIRFNFKVDPEEILYTVSGSLHMMYLRQLRNPEQLAIDPCSISEAIEHLNTSKYIHSYTVYPTENFVLTLDSKVESDEH